MSYVRFYSDASFSLNMWENWGNWDGTLQYSTNASTWTTWNGTTTISAAATSGVYNLYLRGINNSYITMNDPVEDYAHGFEFTYTQPIDCEGNIESLLDYTTVDNGQHPFMDEYAFKELFLDQIALRTAPELGAITLAPHCYADMFSGCTSLTTAPELPATILTSYCYRGMFYSCASLTTAPKLPATTLAPYCYAEMFSGCTSLTSLPMLYALDLNSISSYNYMFANTGISITTTSDSTHVNQFRIPAQGTGSPSNTTATAQMFYGNTGSVVSPSINTIYYANVDIIDSAIKYMVTKSELSSIANAIRGKTGNNIPLTYPDDFISELNNIQPGEMTTFLSGSSLPANSLGVDGDFYTYTGS